MENAQSAQGAAGAGDAQEALSAGTEKSQKLDGKGAEGDFVTWRKATECAKAILHVAVCVLLFAY